MDATRFNSEVSFSRAAVGVAMGAAYGQRAKAFADVILGNPNYLTQIAEMGDRKENGTLDSGDYATLAKIIGDVAIGMAVVGGASISLPIAAAWMLTGIALSIYNNRENIEEFIDKVKNASDWSQGDPFTGLPWPGAVSEELGSTPDPLVKTIRYVDPLILDLDGDGLEITRVSEQVLFDANGDGIKTATAWAGADDGLVVWDRDGNGTIDTGAELFGDQTVLADGSRAPDGFAALSDLDSNRDGSFDAHDAHFADLRIWRDLNQDGISDASELRSLADSGVRSIGLASQAPDAAAGVYADAQLIKDGSFTRTDGSTGQAGSFNLAQNSFVRAFVPIAVSQAASALPAVRGSGWVRDLQEAATLDPALIDLLNAAKNAPTRAGYVEGVSRRGRKKALTTC